MGEKVTVKKIRANQSDLEAEYRLEVSSIIFIRLATEFYKDWSDEEDAEHVRHMAEYSAGCAYIYAEEVKKRLWKPKPILKKEKK